MDPHFTRKQPTPSSLSGGSGAGSGNSMSSLSSSGGSGSCNHFMNTDGSHSAHMTDAHKFQNNHTTAATEQQQRETEDQLQLAIKNTLACVRVLLTQPRSSDLVRGFISQSLAPANSTTNSSHLIDLRTLEAHLPPDSSSSSSSSPPPSSSSSSSNDSSAGAVQSTAASIISGANETSARVDLLGLYDRLPASTSSLPLDALSHEWQVLLVVIYSLTAITSFLLNMITLVVLSRCQRTELRKYLINLSLSDLLMSMFSIPFTYTEYMLGHWLFGAFLCPFIRFVVTLSVFVSIATMTVIGINRHLAIMYPLKRKNNSKWKHWTSWNKTHVIVGIWVLGTAISLPEYLAFAELPFCYNNLLYYECRNTWPDQIANPYTIFIFLSTFAIPLALLSYLYTSIGLKLWRRQMPGNVDINRDLTMQTKRAKVVKMLLVVVVLFAVMWLPLQTFSMVNFLYPDIRGNTEYASLGYNIFVGTYFGCHWLGMAHSCVSPLVYCFMNKKFRTDLRNLLCPLRALVGGHNAGLNGLVGSKGGGGLCESYNSATFRTSGHSQNNHQPGRLQHSSVRLRSGNPHSMNSNSVRVRGGGSSTYQSTVSRQLSKTNSLSSLRTSSRLGPQTSNELRKPSTSTESGVKPQSPASHAADTSKQVVAISQEQVAAVQDQNPEMPIKEPSDHVPEHCASGQDAHGTSRTQGDHQVAPLSGSDESTKSVQSPTIVKMKMVQSSLFERQVLMSKLSETSATETLHEIDEESEEEDEDDDDELISETGSGRLVTIRHRECDYAILEPTAANAKIATSPSDGSGGAGSHEHGANV